MKGRLWTNGGRRVVNVYAGRSPATAFEPDSQTLYKHGSLIRPIRLLLCVLLVLSFLGAHTACCQTKRILIVGDSWAASIATKAVDVSGFGSFDGVLAANGLGAYTTEGERTAWGGRKASDFAKPENLKRITDELERYPSIDLVHLIIGGNDFLQIVAQGKSIASYSEEERARLWDAIEADIQVIVNHCLAQRPGMKVLISDYDYLDAEKAQAAYPQFSFGGATPRQLNDAFVELGRRKLAIAQRTAGCYYVSNWGALQCAFDYPRTRLPVPGGPPDYTPYAGGNPDKPMPSDAHVGDGIHPTDPAHRKLLQRCIDQFYKNVLKQERFGQRP